MSIRSDVQKGKDWLKSWPQRWFSVQEVQREANLSIGTPALVGKFRLARQRGELESRIRDGKTYKEYRYNPDWKPQERPVKATPRSFYWYTLKQCPIASPMFASIAQLKMDIHYTPGCRIWTGTHESPILWEGK